MCVKKTSERVRWVKESGMVEGYEPWSIRAGLSQNVANRIALGTENPGVQTIRKLALAVNPPIASHWLAWGIGTPRDPELTEDPLYPSRSFAVHAVRSMGRDAVAKQLIANDSFPEDPGPTMWLRLAAELIDQEDRLLHTDRMQGARTAK